MEGELIKIALTHCDICDKLKACLVEPGEPNPDRPDVLYEDECAFCLDCIKEAFATKPIHFSLREALRNTNDQERI